MINVYIAASFPRKEEAQALCEQLEASGKYSVQSTWHKPRENPEYDACKEHAERDFWQVAESGMLIQFTGDSLTKGGRHSELGLALAWKKVVYLVGPREQVFHSMIPDERIFENVSEAVRGLQV